MSLDEVDGNVYILRHLRAVFCSGMIDDRARVSSCSTRKQSNKDKVRYHPDSVLVRGEG